MIGLELIAKLRFMEYKDIAERIGVTPQTINAWIKGRRKIPLRRKEQLSVLLNVNEDLIDKYLKDEEIVNLRDNILKNEIGNIDKEESEDMLENKYNIETSIDIEIDAIKDSRQLCLFNEFGEDKNKKII
ncbi:helix-turn-helix domain-containing protein [Clostridium novyi]|uniref:helix-turn-helix domain-containing protein n=1 Tax=Clostridium novyi TaxID=1542 RepID=UPI0004D816A1|nr:helix-turn-helix transcriptional regulator [Clostridium novyi]KEH91616.1 hypothetical protein Z964_08900 [Clostridium novyi A str. GD211209]